jgi:chromosome segregation ATPase
MRDWLDNVFIATATIITGLLSWAAARYAQKNQSVHHKASQEIDRARLDDAHAKTIFEGYSGIVDDLREEVARLNTTIDQLRTDQEECEKRNDALESIVLDLQRRLANLEMDSER